MTSSPDLVDLITMAKTVYGEARGTSTQDRQATALVMLNRARAAAKHRQKTGETIHILFGDGTVETACLMPKQFSCWNVNDPNKALLDKLTVSVDLEKDIVFRRCFVVAWQVLMGEVKDFTNGSLHYHTIAMGWPKSWGKQKTPVFSSSHHHFYNNVD